ncbi:MAG: hypothetical protein JSU66_08020, partial [Deltaproteobacteria bacterium]
EHHRVVEFSRRAGLLSESLEPGQAADCAELVFRLSRVLRLLGQRDEAARLLETTRRGAEDRGDRELVLKVELRQAFARRDVDEERVRVLAEHFGCTEIGGQAHQLLGTLAKAHGDLDAADREFRRAHEIYEAVGLEARQTATLDQLGSVALRAGRHAEAEELYAKAQSLAAGIGMTMNAAVSGVNRVSAAMSRGRLDGLAPILETAIRTFELAGSPHNAAHVRLNLAELRYALGDGAGAARALDEALPALRRTKYVLALGAALRLQGTLLAVRGDLEASRERLEEARELAERAGDHGQLATTWVALAHRHCFAGDPELAGEAVRHALALVKGTPHGFDDLVLMIAEAGLHGLAADVLADAADALTVEESSQLHGIALAGARAYAEPGGSTEALSAAAAALRTRPVGQRQAVLRVLADWLEAEALRREGDTEGSRSAARCGLHAAASLGHVWLKSGLERYLV